MWQLERRGGLRRVASPDVPHFQLLVPEGSTKAKKVDIELASTSSRASRTKEKQTGGYRL